MNRGTRTLAAGALALALGLAAFAAAQQTDTFLQRYDLAIENLTQAVASVPGDSAKARSDLDQASNALLSLSRESTSATLVKAMQTLFSRARTAVDNQSKTDLAVQAAVLAGGFQRLTFDSAFKAAVAGDMTTAKRRLEAIATDMKLDPTSVATMRNAGGVDALRLATEAAIGRTIAEEASIAQRLLTTDRGVAYQTLAEAYGASLLVQDSPRLQSGFNQHFVDAAEALVAKDDAAFGKATQAISAAASSLVQTDTGALAGAGTAAPPTPSTAAAPSALPAVTPGATPTATPSAGATAPTASSGGTPPAAATPAAQLLAEQQQAKLDALTAEVQKAGLPGAKAGKLAATLLAANMTSLQDVTRSLYASAAEASAALMAGDVSGARAHVSAASKRYDTLLSPLLAVKDPALDSRTKESYQRTADLVGLRLQDLENLTAQTDAVARAVSGVASPANLGVNRSIDSWWSGWPRLLVMLLLGLLVFVPLILLNLAFGGGNRNWQLIGFALFLLLLPVLYEALAALGSLVAKLTGSDGFDVLASYSMFQSSLGHVVWAALVLLAIILATMGLYGICVQFGLLGRGRGGRGTGVHDTATPTSTGRREASDAIADWDDEF